MMDIIYFEFEESENENHADKSMVRKSWEESKEMWIIAAPAILTSVSQFSLGFVTIVFAGHLGDTQLAAVAVAQNVLQGFVYGIMLGMGSALETFCGQTVGAGQYEMLGIFLQRSCIITLITSLFLLPFYIFTSPILKFLRQDEDISEVAGEYAILIVPQLFAYALNFPIQKFLQAQSKIWVMTLISFVALALHVLLNWVFVTKLSHGLTGAAVAGNIAWWFLIITQALYIVTGSFPEAWTGFSVLAFKSLTDFVKLSLSSGLMLCLELWYNTVVILMVGWLKNPEIAVDAVSICMTLQLWTLIFTLGFNAAVSVRVSNELGAGCPKTAQFSVKVAVVTSSVLGVIFGCIIFAWKNNFPRLFSTDSEIISETSELGYFLAASILLNSIHPVLHGVAVGAGWQLSVAMVNVGCYYAIGIPVGGLLGYRFNLGVQGIWSGLLAGCLLQTIILSIYTCNANWPKEVLEAEERVQLHGTASPQDEVVHSSNDIGIGINY